MSVSLGSLFVSSGPNLLHATLTSQSMFYATVFLVAALVFAYLTNPSESSFKAFLTEQSFRHHLTHLDESPDSKDTHSGVYFTSQSPANFRFHFANRASVVIRTPSHVYHNFILFTIALIVPSRPCSNSSEDHAFNDTWFLGAFGGWWRGGSLSAFWVDPSNRSKDEESTRSGVLNIKNLDTSDEHNVLPFSSFEAQTGRGAPPKLRQQPTTTDQSQQLQHRPPPARSTTPPPLPKCASLPLHAARQATPISHSHSLPSTHPSSSSTHSSSTNLFDQSPAIAELLRQISSSRSEVRELHNQLGEFENASNQQRKQLSQELEAQKERKREEDSTKLELKSKTKNLEDSKRTAESNKRDTDKKLKAAQLRRAEAERKIKSLNGEISKAKADVEADLRWIQREKGEIVDGNKEKGEARYLEDQLENKKTEIKVVEEVIVALNSRVKEIEDKIAEEKERLKRVVEEAHLRKLRQKEEEIFVAQSIKVDGQDNLFWPPANSHHPSPTPSLHEPELQRMELDVPAPPIQQLSPRRKTLSLSGAITGAASENKDHRRTLTTFAPFDELLPTLNVPITENAMMTPSSLIPRTLIGSISGSSDEMGPRSFQSDSDPFIIRNDRKWKRHSGGFDGLLSTSPASIASSRLPDGTPESTRSSVSDSRGSAAYLDHEYRHIRSAPLAADAMDMQRAFFRVPDRTSTEPLVQTPDLIEPVPPRRWFSTKERSRPLNAHAKEFSLGPSLKIQSLLKPPGHFDALNPSSNNTSPGAGVATTPASTSQFFYKAFAPSPEERAALGVGTRMNGSLEKLPSLSDVGSLRTSPAHVHAVPTSAAPSDVSASSGRGRSSFAGSMVWGRALPRRTAHFSPFEDDER